MLLSFLLSVMLQVTVDVGSSFLADLHMGFPPPHCRLSSTPAFLSGVSGQGLQAQATLADHEGDQCSTRLSCAQELSKKKALYSTNGIVGAVCVHGVPLLGSFCALRGTENYVYYLVSMFSTRTKSSNTAWTFRLSVFNMFFSSLQVILAWLAMYCGSVRNVYVDFGCRLSKSWEHFQQVSTELHV